MMKRQLIAVILLSTIVVNTAMIQGAIAQAPDCPGPVRGDNFYNDPFEKAVIVQHPNRERIDQLKADMPVQERRTYLIRRVVMGAAATAAVYTAGRFVHQWATAPAAPKVEKAAAATTVTTATDKEDLSTIGGHRVSGDEGTLKLLNEMYAKQKAMHATQVAWEPHVYPSAWSLAWIGKNMQFYGIPLISIVGMGLSYLKDVDNKVSQANFVALMENLQALAQFGEFFDDFKLQNQLPRFVENDPSRLMGLIILMTDRLVDSIESTIAYLEFRAEQLPAEAEKQQENIKSLALYFEGMTESFATDVDQLLTSKDLEPKSLKGLVMDFMAKANVFFISARTALADKE